MAAHELTKKAHEHSIECIQASLRTRHERMRNPMREKWAG
jgi:hypothetical protein